MFKERPGVAALIALILVWSLVSAPLQADHRYAQAESSKSRSVQISPDRAAAIARDATGGRVLKVELRSNGRPVYRVKVLLEGERVRSVRIDAQTGRVLN